MGKPLVPRRCFGETSLSLCSAALPLAPCFPRPLFPSPQCPLPFLAGRAQPEAGRCWSQGQGMAPGPLCAAPCPAGLGALRAPHPFPLRVPGCWVLPFLLRGSPLAAVVGLGPRASPGLSESNYFFKNKHCTAAGPRVFCWRAVLRVTATDGGTREFLQLSATAESLNLGTFGPNLLLWVCFLRNSLGKEGWWFMAGCLLGQPPAACPAVPVPAEVLRALAAARVPCFLLKLYQHHLQLDNWQKL